MDIIAGRMNPGFGLGYVIGLEQLDPNPQKLSLTPRDQNGKH
jgi:hypothetical protein